MINRKAIIKYSTIFLMTLIVSLFIYVIRADPISYNNSTLIDHTQVVDNIAFAERFGMNISLPFTTQDIDGKDILIPVTFAYNGLQTKNISWLFVFDYDLESGGAFIYRDVNETYNYGVPKLKYISNYLVTFVNSSNLGTPTSACQIGSVENNTMMYQVTTSNNTILNYCFNDFTPINSTAVIISGSYWGSEILEGTKVVNKRIDISDKFTKVGNNLLNDERSYYLANSREYSPGDRDDVEIVFTPKDKTKAGKFHIIGFEKEYGLVDSILDDRYIYLDPWWNSTWNKKRNITNIYQGKIINLTYVSGMDNDFKDIRFLDTSEATERNYCIESKVSGGSAIVHLANNDSGYLYYNSSGASSTSSCSAVYPTMVHYYPFNYNGNDLMGTKNLTVSGSYSVQQIIGAVAPSGGSNTTFNIAEVDNAEESFSICFNHNRTGACGTYPIIVGNANTGANIGEFQIYCFNDGHTELGMKPSGAWQTIAGSIPKVGNPEHTCLTFNGTTENASLYQGGMLKGTKIYTGYTPYTAHMLHIFSTVNGGQTYSDGVIDEMKFFNTVLTPSEILALNNSFNSSYTLGDEESGTPANTLTVDLSYPINNSKLNSYNLFLGSYNVFECNYTATGLNNNISYTNLSIYNSSGSRKYGSLSTKTNTTASINETYNINLNTDGLYNWQCTGRSTSGVNATTEYWTVLVDRTLPTLTLTNPTAINYTSSATLTTLNYSVSDTNLDSCWYSVNATNTSIACGTNATGLTPNQGSNTWYIYANDTYGNLQTRSVTFIYDSLNPSIKFINPTPNNNAKLNTNSFIVNVFAYDTYIKNLTTFLYNSSNASTSNNFTTSFTYSECFQETTNKSHATDGNCLLNYTGAYYYDPSNFQNGLNSIDGDYTTWDTDENSYFYINYTKPINAVSAKWRVRVGQTPVFKDYNLSINSTCFNQDILQLRVKASTLDFDDLISLECFDSSWIIVFYNNTASGIFYEEGIYWNVSENPTNFSGLSDGIYYFNATATDHTNHINRSTTRVLSIDATKPSVFINYPLSQVYDYSITNITFNVTDTNIDSCLLSNDTGKTNVTISCYLNITYINDSAGSNRWYIYANDTYGNWNLTTFISFIMGNITADTIPSGGGGGGASYIDQVTGLPKDLDEILCVETYNYIQVYGQNNFVYLNQFIQDQRAKGGIYSASLAQNYIMNWQKFCSDKVKRTLKESDVCTKIYYFLLGNDNIYSATEVFNLKQEIKPTVEISDYLLNYYLDNYELKCEDLTGLVLPKTYYNVTKFNIFKATNIKDCSPETGIELLEANIGASVPFLKIYFSDLTCNKINIYRWIFNIESDETAYYINGIRIYVVVLMLSFVTLFYFKIIKRKK